MIKLRKRPPEEIEFLIKQIFLEIKNYKENDYVEYFIKWLKELKEK